MLENNIRTRGRVHPRRDLPPRSLQVIQPFRQKPYVRLTLRTQHKQKKKYIYIFCFYILFNRTPRWGWPYTEEGYLFFLPYFTNNERLPPSQGPTRTQQYTGCKLTAATSIFTENRIAPCVCVHNAVYIGGLGNSFFVTRSLKTLILKLFSYQFIVDLRTLLHAINHLYIIPIMTKCQCIVRIK